MSLKLDIDASGAKAATEQYEAFMEARVQRAMLRATDRAARNLASRVRGDMQGARLGSLGRAYGMTSDEERRGAVHPQGDGFSASGMLYVRTRSDRTRGALESYTRGSSIAPTRGRWLWLPTNDIPRIASGRTRLTPANWSASGMDQRIGPLVMVRSVNGLPLLIVKNASVALSGKSRSAKSRTKTGKLKKGQAARDFLVAFIAIPRTARAARVDVNAMHAQAVAELPALFSNELRRA